MHVTRVAPGGVCDGAAGAAPVGGVRRVLRGQGLSQGERQEQQEEYEEGRGQEASTFHGYGGKAAVIGWDMPVIGAANHHFLFLG